MSAIGAARCWAASRTARERWRLRTFPTRTWRRSGRRRRRPPRLRAASRPPDRSVRGRSKRVLTRHAAAWVMNCSSIVMLSDHAAFSSMTATTALDQIALGEAFIDDPGNVWDAPHADVLLPPGRGIQSTSLCYGAHMLSRSSLRRAGTSTERHRAGGSHHEPRLDLGARGLDSATSPCELRDHLTSRQARDRPSKPIG